MLHEVAMRVRALQNPSPDIINIIKNLFNAPSTENTNSTFSFAQASRNVLEQKTNPQTTIFGQKPQTTNIFAQANQALFGDQQQKNVFGSTVQQQLPTNSIFAPQQSVFGSQFTGNSFSQQQQQPTTVFQTQANVFQTTQQTTVFQTQPTQSSVFQTQPTKSHVFQTQPAQSNIFQSQQSLNQMNIFGGGTNTEQIGMNLGKLQGLDESAYSKKECLTESEIKAFEADLFEFGKIPEKPPTIEMCF